MRQGALRSLAWCLIAVATAVCVTPAPAASADSAPFQLVEPRRLELTYVVTVRSNAAVSDLELQVPLFSGTLPPHQNLAAVTVLPPGRLQNDENGSMSARARWASLSPESPVTLVMQVQLQLFRPLFRIDPGLCLTPARAAGLAPYLQPEPGIESDHRDIRECARKVVGESSNPYEMSRLLFAFVNGHMRYDESAPSRGALWALESRRGVCQDYTNLYVALCRACGIPARRVYGFRYNLSDDGDLTSPRSLAGKRHVWAEVYLGQYRWVPVDPTFTYRVNGQKTVNFDYFGSFPPDDLHIATGFDDRQIEWRFRYSGKAPAVEAELSETLVQLAP